MVTKGKTLINCKCLKEKKMRDLTQSDDCICRIGTSARTDRRIIVRRVNVIKVDEFSAFD